MPDILPLHSNQIGEAKRVIYAVAHALFHDWDTLEEALASYPAVWPLHDIDDFQHCYLENNGAFLVMCENGRIIGTGALRRLEETVGEIKRLWLLPEYQGQGLGYRMMWAWRWNCDEKQNSRRQYRPARADAHRQDARLRRAPGNPGLG